MKARTPKILLLLVLVLNVSGFAWASAGPNVEDRIATAIRFIVDQSSTSFSGFLHGTNSSVSAQRIYAYDNGIVALALSSYQQTHNSEAYYNNLKSAIHFLQQAQTSSGDFQEYYDPSNGTWGTSGQLYYWNSYALMGAAYGGGEFAAIGEFPAERPYWTDVVNMLRLCVDYWVPRTQLPDGQVVFSFPGASARADVGANAAMLVALIHIALFEYFWGNMDLATKYAQWSQSIANWLYSLQEKSSASWGAGGFYTDAARTIQYTFENGFAMFGLNSYFKAVGLFANALTTFEPSVSELRQSMINWTEKFVETTVDSWNGPQYGRSIAGLLPYPKETASGASLLQALVDVVINIGSPYEECAYPQCYWSEVSKVYEWFTGSNELSLDLQQAKDIHGGVGGFYTGIQSSGAIMDSNVAVTAFALFAMVRASYIEVSELTWPLVSTWLVMCLALLVFWRFRASREDINR
jgi:hypothetical protein